MAEIRVGTAIYRRNLSPILAVFRLTPQDGDNFPPYKAGQYIALRRTDCRLTKRTVRPDGTVAYLPDLDTDGNQRRGPVTHSYSISSAPFETAAQRFLEFYVILEMHETGEPGRLTESLFQIDPDSDRHITYFTKIAGDFILESRKQGAKNVVFVGTGTGLAPFASMVKQLHYEASNGHPTGVRYTLFHANRTFDELGYHQEFLDIEKARKFDFVYVPSVSRPSGRDLADGTVGKGRANNVLRSVLGMPLKEEEHLVQAGSGDERAKAALANVVRPVLPIHLTQQHLLDRMHPPDTVILTCGNPKVMEDIRHIAGVQKIRFEMEEW